MIKTILFDFDGVISESVHIKTEAFRDLFKDENIDSLAKIIDYHKKHGGINRKNKIIYFYREILKRNLSDEKLNYLMGKFSKLVKDKVVEASHVKGVRNFIESNYDKYNFYIVSGTPQKEMEEIIDRKGIGGYFKDIYGYPPGKTEIINKFLLAKGEKKEEVVFVGDSVDDLKGAKNSGVKFIGRLLPDKENKEFYKGKFPVISDFENIKKIIESL